MVKAYLRYEHAARYGVVASSGCNVSIDREGRTLYCGSLEDVNGWSIRQGVLASELKQEHPEIIAAAPLATCTAPSPSAAILAVGYGDGSIRLWDTDTATCTVTFNGHSGAVTALAFNGDGTGLASGARDTEVIVWDVVAERGLARLRAHTDQITGVAFLDRVDALVSTSKDGGLRVWSLTTLHCCQFVPNHVGEIWSLAVDAAQERVAVGSIDANVRLFSVAAPTPDGALDATVTASQSAQGAAAEGDTSQDEGDAGGLSVSSRTDILTPLGAIARSTTQRCAELAFSPDGAFLACASTGKHLQLWRRRPPQEAAKKLKRRRKRHAEKIERRAAGAAETAAISAEGEGSDLAAVSAADEWGSDVVVRTDAQLRSFAFHPHPPKAAALCQLALALGNNTLQIVNVSAGASEVVRTVGVASGNRSDVRAAALSYDDSLLLTTGNGGTKVWNPASGVCVNSLETGYGLCCLFAPGGRYAVLGCKDGKLDVIDLGAAAVAHRVDAHTAQVWSLAELPGGKGFISASADHYLKFWEWGAEATGDAGATRITVTQTKAINTGQDVLCVRVSPDGKLVAASLISNVIKVFYLDSMKWFIDLYGHKLPALAMDISSDSTLLVSGSADKNIKIWGLDFGDCHKSIFAHQDSVMAVAFVRGTHYCFTAGKDKMLKYWDADKFELLLELPAHHAEVWCLAVSRTGDFVITGSHDRSVRRWEKTDEPFFIDEEKERRLESLFEGDEGGAAQRRPALTGEDAADGVAEPAGKKSQEAVSAVDRVIEALDMAAAEEDRKADASFTPNPLMLGQSGSAYVLSALQNVRANDLETVLLLLPFSDARVLLSYLPSWLTTTAQVELTVRVAVLLLKIHHAQLAATPSCRGVLTSLRTLLRGRLQSFKNVMGFNIAAVRHLQHQLHERGAPGTGSLPVKRKLVELTD